MATQLLDWHIRTNGDELVKLNPTWFVSLVWFELLFQLPFFFVAIYAYLSRSKWIRIPLIVYGIHTATTLIPILGEILFVLNNIKLALIYAPYFILPLAIAIKNVLYKDPFPFSRAKKAPRNPKKR